MIKNALEEFISENGTDPIKNFLPLADFCFTELGLEQFKKQSVIWQFLQANTFDTVVGPLVHGKRVAIVGNGSCELGKSSGPEIDNHDFVIRFNNFDLTYQRDYGGKIDCWVRNVGGNDLNNTIPEGINLIVFTGDFRHCKILDRDVEFAYEALRKNKKILCMSPETISSLYKRSGIVFPTSGLVTIYAVSRLGADKINIYGFSNLDANPTDLDSHNHYYRDRTQAEALRRGSPHSIRMEREYLRTITKGRTIEFPDDS